MSKTKRTQQKYRNTANCKSKVYDAYYECKHLDYLANVVNDWELEHSHLAVGMPKIEDIEAKQRELLITAMYYNQFARIENAGIDEYFHHLVTVLAK